MWWPARQEHHDDRFVRTSSTGRLLRLQQLWQRDATEGEAADSEDFTSRETVAVSYSATVNREHDAILVTRSSRSRVSAG
jgi:hypothetical protein